MAHRSALFLSSEHLQAIIIDEEHDTSYKNNTTPRYQTRHVAQYKAKQQQCLLILGSATPSIDLYYYLQKDSNPQPPNFPLFPLPPPLNLLSKILLLTI